MKVLVERCDSFLHKLIRIKIHHIHGFRADALPESLELRHGELKGKYFKYQSKFRILDDRIYLTKNSPQKYESLATIDDDHNVIEIANGLRDITRGTISSLS